jgi:hypothetical protein
VRSRTAAKTSNDSLNMEGGQAAKRRKTKSTATANVVQGPLAGVASAASVTFVVGETPAQADPSAVISSDAAAVAPVSDGHGVSVSGARRGSKAAAGLPREMLSQISGVTECLSDLLDMLPQLLELESRHKEISQFLGVVGPRPVYFYLRNCTCVCIFARSCMFPARRTHTRNCFEKRVACLRVQARTVGGKVSHAEHVYIPGMRGVPLADTAAVRALVANSGIIQQMFEFYQQKLYTDVVLQIQQVTSRSNAKDGVVHRIVASDGKDVCYIHLAPGADSEQEEWFAGLQKFDIVTFPELFSVFTYTKVPVTDCLVETVHVNEHWLEVPPSIGIAPTQRRPKILQTAARGYFGTGFASFSHCKWRKNVEIPIGKRPSIPDSSQPPSLGTVEPALAPTSLVVSNTAAAAPVIVGTALTAAVAVMPPQSQSPDAGDDVRPPVTMNPNPPPGLIPAHPSVPDTQINIRVH